MTTETAATPHIELPGGEMLAWSDQRGDRPVSGGAPLAALAVRLTSSGGRVLLAGYHDPALVDRLLAGPAAVTCLVRGYPDGVTLAQRTEGESPRVVVGGPQALGDGERFDVVIAGAGLSAVESVEGAQVGWRAVLDRLVASLVPGGVLVLRLDNPLGLHRIVDVSPWYAGRDSAAWSVSGVLDAGRPANPAELRETLAAAGLETAACYAAFANPAAPTALLDVATLDRAPASGLLDAALHDACTRGFAGQLVLRDPARLAVDALHAGLASRLAPAWFAVAGPPAAAPGLADLPVALLQMGSPDSDVAEVAAGPDGWHWRPPQQRVRAEPEVPFATRWAAHRDPQALRGPVAPGRLLRTVLLDACLRRDLTVLRRMLGGYASWLAASADGEHLAGAYALAAFDNVVVEEDSFALLDPSWRSAEPLTPDLVLTRGLWRFAAELATGGYAHPWPSTLDVAGLTLVLGGLAGRELDRAGVAVAVSAEMAITVAVRGLDGQGRLELDRQLQALQPTTPSPGVESYQQLREAWLRQGDEIARLRALMSWNEELLTSRERALKRAELAVSLLSGSVSFKVGRLMITPARLLRRLARRLRARLRRNRPEAKP